MAKCWKTESFIYLESVITKKQLLRPGSGTQSASCYQSLRCSPKETVVSLWDPTINQGEGVQHCSITSITLLDRVHDTVQTPHTEADKCATEAPTLYLGHQMARQNLWCGCTWKSKDSQCRGPNHCFSASMGGPYVEDARQPTHKSSFIWRAQRWQVNDWRSETVIPQETHEEWCHQWLHMKKQALGRRKWRCTLKKAIAKVEEKRKNDYMWAHERRHSTVNHSNYNCPRCQRGCSGAGTQGDGVPPLFWHLLSTTWRRCCSQRSRQMSVVSVMQGLMHVSNSIIT